MKYFPSAGYIVSIFSRYSTRELIAWPSGLVCVKQSPSATQVDIFPNWPTCESANYLGVLPQ